MSGQTIKPLNAGQKHVIRLIVKERDSNGWAKVSGVLYPTLSSTTPSELVCFEKTECGGRCRLTEKGECVAYAMPWLCG